MVTVIVRPVAGSIVLAMDSRNYIEMELGVYSFIGIRGRIIILTVVVKPFTCW